MQKIEYSGGNISFLMPPRSIADPVYEHIEIPELCDAFIKTEEFSRLMFIMQTGMTFLVYPGARHTRYEHCIGVMHLAGETFNCLMRNSPEQWRKWCHLKRLVELGGLCHDLGHVGLSHLPSEALQIMDTKFTEDFKLAAGTDEDSVPFCHERFSVFLVKRINARLKLLTPREESIVANIIKKNGSVAGVPAFVFGIVNSILDVDKMDYLMRDTHHVGFNAKPDVRYIINNASIDDFGHIVYNTSAADAIERLFEIRKSCYKAIYYHRDVVAADRVMLCCVMQMINEFLASGRAGGDGFVAFLLGLDDVQIFSKCREMQHDIVKAMHTMDMAMHRCEKCTGTMLSRQARLSNDVPVPMDMIRFKVRDV